MSFPPSVMSLVGMPQVFLCVCWCFLSCIVRRNWKLCLEISMAAKLLGVTPRTMSCVQQLLPHVCVCLRHMVKPFEETVTVPKPAVPVVPSAVEVTDPPVKKTVVVPKNAHIPIRQDVRNIFDRQVCKGINWNEGGGGRVPKQIGRASCRERV